MGARGVGGREDQNFRQEARYAAGWKVHYRDHLTPHHVLRAVVDGVLAGGSLDAKRGTEIDLHPVSGFDRSFERSGGEHGTHAEVEIQELVESGHSELDLNRHAAIASRSDRIRCMAGPTRNDPCPCGSGKKYKACCLDKDEALRRGEHPHEPEALPNFRVKLVDDMLEFTNSAHKKVLKAARDAYPRLDDFGEEENEVEPLDEEEELDWTERWINAVLFDLPANRDGEVVAEAYLRKQAAKLNDEERAWLTVMSNTSLIPYEVGEVTPGVGFVVRSLANGSETFLAEPLASEDVEAGDLLAGRVTNSQGAHVMEGGTYSLLEGTRAFIEGEIKAYTEENGASSFDDLPRPLQRSFAAFVHQLWTAMVLDATAPAADDDADRTE